MDEWTGGRAVVELLKAEGVRQIFGIVGSTFLDVLDTLYDDSSVEYINVRHEQAAAFMADGLARVTDRPGVCLVTSGPGATNLLTGVAAAYVAHSPVVVLVGGIALDHYQKDAFQEYDLVGMFRPVTKQALQINKAERIPELLRGALRTAMSGRQGPVFVEIPRDVLSGTLPPTAALAPGRYRVTHAQPPHADAVREAVQRLRQAERPLLLIGGGASRAGANELVVQLSDRYGIPMITAYGRNDAVPNAHPLYLGPLGRAGAPEAAAGLRRAPPRACARDDRDARRRSRSRLRIRSTALHAAAHVPHTARSRRPRLRVSRRAGRQARPAGGSGRRHPRRWRLPDERPGARDRGAARHRSRDDRDEQQLLGIGEGVPEALLRRALHRLRHRQPAL